MKTSKSYLSLAVVLFSWLLATPIQAASLQDAFGGPALSEAAQTAGYATTTSNSALIIASNIINIIVGLLGVAFLVLMVYGGFLWMTAGGNEKQVSQAKSIIKNSFIGVIIVLSAYAITYFIIKLLPQLN